MADTRRRGGFLTAMAVGFALLCVSNLSKPLQYWNNPEVGGIVIFGVRFESIASNAVLGPLMALVLGAYSYGLWKLQPWVAPLSIAYAFYVPVNLALFWYFQISPERPPVVGLLVYLAVALTGSVGTALHLAYHRDKLAA
jgi:hypothetical protein